MLRAPWLRAESGIERFPPCDPAIGAFMGRMAPRHRRTAQKSRLAADPGSNRPLQLSGPVS